MGHGLLPLVGGGVFLETRRRRTGLGWAVMCPLLVDGFGFY